MITSMTGFASLTREDDLAAVSVTARSVNHRFLDIQIRVPPAFAALESRLRERIQQRLARGRVELGVTLQVKAAAAVEVAINDALVAALVKAAERPEIARATTGGWVVGDLLRFPQVVAIRERPRASIEEEQLVAAVLSAADDALVELAQMRSREGEFLRADLDGRRAALADLVERIATEAAAAQTTARDRLTARVGELATEIATDAGAVAQEVVRWAARSDIHEEVARLEAHLAHWTMLADAPDACGRKLDFLLQEMNREINTLGAKIEGYGVSELIVAAKAELEKLREQAQNVE